MYTSVKLRHHGGVQFLDAWRGSNHHLVEENIEDNNNNNNNNNDDDDVAVVEDDAAFGDELFTEPFKITNSL